MKKNLILPILSTLIIPQSIDQIKTTYQAHEILKGIWIDNLHPTTFGTMPMLQNLNPILYEDKKIIVKLQTNDLQQTVANIYAKQAQKNYYLQLENYHLNQQPEMLEFITNKFYSDKLETHYMSANDFYLLMDTAEKYGGEISAENENVKFRSSWGVWNGSGVKNSWQFHISRDQVAAQIAALDSKNGAKINHKTLYDLKIQPTKFNYLPLVGIYQTPIGNAHWTTEQIQFQNQQYYPFQQQLSLLLPDGHNTGAEWWRGLVSALIFVGQVLTAIFWPISEIMGLKISQWIVEHGLTKFVQSIVSYIFKWKKFIDIGSKIYKWFDDIGPRNLDHIKIQKIIQNIHKIIQQHSLTQRYNFNFFDWDDIGFGVLKNTVTGNLHGEANATSIWGRESEMRLLRAMGTMNANVKYTILKL